MTELTLRSEIRSDGNKRFGQLPVKSVVLLARIISGLATTLIVIGLGPGPYGAGPAGDVAPLTSTFELAIPLDCRLGETCWVANYVNVDPSGAAKDFRCGPRTYDGHDGVDFAIRDEGVMVQGVTVLASAPGTVRSVRDGMADRASLREDARGRIAGRECGNGIVIDHEDGWQTQYCHLRKESVLVHVGELVNRGTPLGLVGLSGKTEFPHLHLTVRNRGQVVDPFTGQRLGAGCGSPVHPVWQAPGLEYESAALYNAGFSDGPPNIVEIRKGIRPGDELPRMARVLVLWVDAFGVQVGDEMRFQIFGPDGQPLLDKRQRVDRTQARRFAFAGARLRESEWASGLYSGRITLTRNQDGVVSTRSILVQGTIR
jgi:murein DD-endopeptidase MepM/ murein hydrolase activator NlpD